MKKIQRWIKSITLTILMIGAMTSVSAKTFFPLFLTSDVSNPVYVQDIQNGRRFSSGLSSGLSSVGLRLIDDKKLQFFYKWKNNPYDYVFNWVGIKNKENELFLETYLSRAQINPQIVDVDDWTWVNGDSFYAHIDTPEDLQSFNLFVGYRDPTLNIYPVSLKDLNLNIDHLFPAKPDYENLRIEKKSDASAKIFYAIEPTAPATIPAGYNFHFTRLEAEYAAADNPVDARSIELSFNAQRQAYSAVLDNLEGETDYLINRLIWHYTLTDQSDSSKSYPLFSSLPLPSASNSFNLNNLVTDAYVFAASGKPPATGKTPATETSSNLTTIIGVSAGIGGSLLVFSGIGYWFYRRRKKS